jgi:isopenicillin N synthase-like dioxygenase
MSDTVPLIDVEPLVSGRGDQPRVAAAIAKACRDNGFFYVVGHGVDPALQAQLEALSRAFFAQAEAVKMRIAMEHGGRAWRGYFPVGGELTSGKRDLKEGVYFGTELAPDHPDVVAGLPLHGANLFPESPAALKPVVLAYIAAVTDLGHALMRGVALSLGLDAGFFAAHYTRDPLVLFRIFNYPAPESAAELRSTWGVGEHTDYGVLTILKQDDSGGLEVKSKAGWIPAPPVPGAFVCNIGDMLDRMTGGVYRSTPHRVRNSSGHARLSWPLFFDPGFHAEVKALPMENAGPAPDDRAERWDKADVHSFTGTYGEYLLAKVGRVFPDLGQRVLKKGDETFKG